MKTIYLMQALLLAGMVAPVVAETPAAQAPAADLMTMNQDARCKQVLVTCLINGAPMRMMLDTGATHTVLHTESAARVPNPKWLDTSFMQFRGNSAQRPKMLLASLYAGPAESEVHPLMVMDLSAVRSMMAEPVDGILGMDMLQHIPFTFNLKTGEMHWGLPSGLELVPLNAVPDGTGRVVVQARCGGKELPLLLDTGSSVTRVPEELWAPEPVQKSVLRLVISTAARVSESWKANPVISSSGPAYSPRGWPPSSARQVKARSFWVWMASAASFSCTFRRRAYPAVSSCWPGKVTHSFFQRHRSVRGPVFFFARGAVHMCPEV